ncbi:WcaI family glycosyltransferase [Nonlabens ponticola]|uniref:Colanic acid biosynthesis glycosyltransferase WcaI n=1 Tax=Nonlabens ponticola TaxID=2496866 RepID=A0A3S9MVA9_9FLAO|nr:WcaI family glycosyltransferase [Nonlabens ponticola]AZQ43116.1 colanic acid biosynthesis glycosyltransferase WcaI [Nonlabens ponticola]
MLQGKSITFIGLNYAPEDTAIGLYSTQMVDALVAAGAHVNVVTAVPYYPHWKIQAPYDIGKSYVHEKQPGRDIYRYKFYVPEKPSFIKRIIHLLSFSWGSFWNLSRIKKADLVISIIPFTAAAALGKRHAARRKVNHWIHIQDFEFDAALQSGLSGSGKKSIFKALFKFESKLLDRASVVSTISHLMISKLKSKTTSETYYLPNWIDPVKIDPSHSQTHAYLKDPRFKILYSGNVGDKQDWEFFIAFAKALPQKDYHITIVGAGSQFTWLQGQLSQENVSFYEPIPYDDLSDLLCSADAHILFQKEDVIDTVMPSKLLGMMASARPSLVVGNKLSEVKTVIEDAQAGVYMTNYNVDKAIEIMQQWQADQQSQEKLGRSAREYVVANFGKDQILSQWIEALSQQV